MDPSTMSNPIKFGQFIVTSQVFYKSPHSFALVNLKPFLTGHVLVCPLRLVPRISQLTDEENIDFFQTVKKVSRAIELYYKADSLNIAIQDGPLAGQSVPHVHCHIIPRRLNDLPNIDDIYRILDSSENDMDYWYKLFKQSQNTTKASIPDSDDRPPRTEEDMREEAVELKKFMEKEGM